MSNPRCKIVELPHRVVQNNCLIWLEEKGVLVPARIVQATKDQRGNWDFLLECTSRFDTKHRLVRFHADASARVLWSRSIAA